MDKELKISQSVFATSKKSLEQKSLQQAAPSALPINELELDDLHNSAELKSFNSFKEDKPNHKGNVLLTIGLFFLFADFGERFGYYTATGSLYTYFTAQLGLSGLLATQLQSVFQSLVYVAPLIGAYLADAVLGRYKVLMVFFVVYCVGLTVMTIASEPNINLSWLYFIGLLPLTAVGSGCIKPNLIVLGADQFRDDDPYQVKQKSQYFQYFYWMTNIAAFIAFAFMGNVAINGTDVIPQEYGFFSTFAIGCGAIVFATVVFAAGSTKYFKPKPHGSALIIFCKVCFSAALKKKYGMIVLIGFLLQFVSFALTIVSFFITSTQAVGYIAAAFSVIGILILVFLNDTNWIHAANQENGGKFTVRETIDAGEVVGMFPYTAFAIMFWCVYNQMNTNYQAQGCQMNVYMNCTMSIAPAQLNTFNCLIIVILIPIVDKLLYPGLEKIGYPMTLMKRIGLGLFITNLSVLLAGIIEIIRKEQPIAIGCDGFEIRSPCNDDLVVRDLNILIQVPQYILVGIGEIFTAITYYDLFYSEVPDNMRAVCQALNMLTTSLGTMVGGTINTVTATWLPDNLDEGHQEYTYFLAFGLGMLNLLGFILVSRKYMYKVDREVELSNEEEKKVQEDFKTAMGFEDEIPEQKSSMAMADEEIEHL